MACYVNAVRWVCVHTWCSCSCILLNIVTNGHNNQGWANYNPQNFRGTIKHEMRGPKCIFYYHCQVAKPPDNNKKYTSRWTPVFNRLVTWLVGEARQLSNNNKSTIQATKPLACNCFCAVGEKPKIYYILLTFSMASIILNSSVKFLSWAWKFN